MSRQTHGDQSSAHHRADPTRVRCAVLTVSDTRTPESDGSGRRIQELLRAAGHETTHYAIIQDEPQLILSTVAAMPDGVEVIILNGGTGVTRRDTTFEAVQRLLEKEITGFGELFRMLSFEDVGARAMLSRATAGVAGRHVIFSLPGATAAVELAMTKLVLPVLGHVVGMVREGA